MQTAIDMHDNLIENVAAPTSGHQATNKGYCDFDFLNRQKGGVIMGTLSMNKNDLIALPDIPKFGSSAVNKNYVDGEICKIPSGFIQKSGDTMSGDLDMDGNFVRNVGIDLSDNAAAMPKSYIDASSTNLISYPITADFNMSNHKVINLKTPTADKDAVNKVYLDEELLKSNLLPSHNVNAFKYLLDVDESSREANITSVSIADFLGSPHKNKKAYSVTFVKTSGSNIYQSTLGINIYTLNVGKYTIVMEYFWPENTNIALSFRVSNPAGAIGQLSKDFDSYSKLAVQFEQKIPKVAPNYLFFDIHGEATVSNPQGYLVFYGVAEWSPSVSPAIYDGAIEDSMFLVDNCKMKMNMDLNMNGHAVINDGQKYFYIGGYYKKSESLLRIRFDNDQYIVRPSFIGAYLIEIDKIIRSDAVGNDYTFVLHFNRKEGKMLHHIFSSDSENNFRWQTMTNFGKYYEVITKRHVYTATIFNAKFDKAYVRFKFMKS